MMKPITSKHSVWALMLLILIGLQINCSVLSAFNPSSAEENTPEESLPTEEIPEEASSSSDNAQDSESPDFLNCPSPGETLYLGFDHTLTINYEGASLTHILHSGMLNLNVQAAADEGEVAVSSTAPITIPYEMQGVIKDCSMEMAGNMIASASGYCEDGTVYLIITEDWQAASGQMVCPDGAVPFQIPKVGKMIHEGADGNGEVFYLVEGSEGYTSMRPFQEGDGYHTWTLYTTQIDPVPLVPGNE